MNSLNTALIVKPENLLTVSCSFGAIMSHREKCCENVVNHAQLLQLSLHDSQLGITFCTL